MLETHVRNCSSFKQLWQPLTSNNRHKSRCHFGFMVAVGQRSRLSVSAGSHVSHGGARHNMARWSGLPVGMTFIRRWSRDSGRDAIVLRRTAIAGGGNLVRRCSQLCYVRSWWSHWYDCRGRRHSRCRLLNRWQSCHYQTLVMICKAETCHCQTLVMTCKAESCQCQTLVMTC